MLLSIEHVTKRYKLGDEKREVLSDLSFSIDRGQIVSISGKSGCGKSTLLNVISGIASPDSGKVSFNGRRIRYLLDFSLSRRRNREFGFIFQTFKLLDNETVLANALLPARIKGDLTRETKDYLMETLGRLRIYKFRNTRVGLLSGGQKQRVAIARALVNRPSLILADEPTANLDGKTSMEIFSILEDLKKEGKAIILVTHEEYMFKRSDAVYFMDKGKLEEMK